jgi:signal peptidase II
MKRTSLKIALNATFLAVLDQAVKWLARTSLKTPYVLTSWFQLRYEQNTGIAWGINMPYPLIIALNIALLLLIPYLAFKNLDLRKSKSQIVLVLIIGGALGNIYDRLVSGYVTDFLAVGWWPVFNLADAFLSTGIFLLLLFYGKIKRA